MKKNLPGWIWLRYPEQIGDMIFSDESVDKMDDREPEVNHPMEENPRVQQIAKKERFAYDENGKPFSKMKQYQLRDGIFEAILDRFYKDPTLVAYGEENRDWGGAFAVYRGLTEAFPITDCSIRPFLKAPLLVLQSAMPCAADV